MSIEVEGLQKIYGTQKAVDGISFSINKGEIVGFLGPNGAGKSTTMKIITGYLLANAGSVKVCGESVELNPVTVKKNIGYLPEANPLYPEMYVREYLDFIAGVHSISNRSAAVEKVITLTGLSVESAKKIHQLSKGYKQRVGLAAALIHNPAVLILDEPTSGLDPNQIIEIRNVIKGQGRDKTVLFSSHILQEVEAICDRVIIINKGKIVANDSLVNLQQLNKDNYQVKVVFKEPVLANSFVSFQAIQQLTAVDASTYLIDTANPDLVRKQLLSLCVAENLNIVSLQTDGNSLEDIFRTLTSVSA